MGKKLLEAAAALLIAAAIILEASGHLVLGASRLTTLDAAQPPEVPVSPYKYVFAFGDSTTDTGNALLSGTGRVAGGRPYGETYFHRPTGRYSDGRLIVDRLCQHLGVPLLTPHLAANPFIRGSENYAVAGATALNVTRLHFMADVRSTTLFSLEVQVDWFLDDIQRLGLTPEDMANSLVYFGEIGGNDYNYALFQARWPAFEVDLRLVDPVIAELATQLERVLETGVEKVIIQGQFPMGCLPAYNGHGVLDSTGCVAQINAMSNRHNQLLLQTLNAIQASYTNVSFVFFDSTSAYLHVLSEPQSFGFFDLHEPCFIPPTRQVCLNPDFFVSFDGVHMTDAMYGALFDLFMQHGSAHSSPNPNFLNTN